MAPSPEAVSNGLAFLQMDLTDPDFHQPALAAARATLVELQRMLDDAVRARRLRRVRHEGAGAGVHAMIGGAMLAWAVLREGTAESMMQSAVATLIEPRGSAAASSDVRRHRAKRRRQMSPAVVSLLALLVADRRSASPRASTSG